MRPCYTWHTQMRLLQGTLLLFAILLMVSRAAMAATTGSISGTVMDPSGAVIPGAMVSATNAATGMAYKTSSNERGFCTFPSLPVGKYDLHLEAAGFTPHRRNGLTIDTGTALQIDMTVSMIEKIEEVTVLSNEIHVETASTQVGEVVTGKAMTAVAVDGDIDSSLFGQVVKAAPPRLMQVALKFTFD